MLSHVGATSKLVGRSWRGGRQGHLAAGIAGGSGRLGAHVASGGVQPTPFPPTATSAGLSPALAGDGGVCFHGCQLGAVESGSEQSSLSLGAPRCRGQQKMHPSPGLKSWPSKKTPGRHLSSRPPPTLSLHQPVSQLPFATTERCRLISRLSTHCLYCKHSRSVSPSEVLACPPRSPISRSSLAAADRFLPFAMSPSSEARSHPITRSNSISSSVASGQTTHSFLPVIEHEDLFSASFVLGAVVESPSSPPRAPYLRPISTMASPKLPAASSSTHTATTAAAFSPSLAGMRSADTLVSVARQPSITSLAMLSQSAASKETLSLPPTRPLVISHQKRSLRSRFSLSRATPAPPPMAEPERTKRAFSLPFNLPSHSTVSLAPSTTSTTSDLTNLLLPEADVREVDDEEAAAEAEDASWIPPPPPAAKGQSEAPVKGKGGPGWYGGKRINERGEVIQVAADGTETVIMRRASLVLVDSLRDRR